MTRDEAVCKAALEAAAKACKTKLEYWVERKGVDAYMSGIVTGLVDALSVLDKLDHAAIIEGMQPDQVGCNREAQIGDFDSPYAGSNPATLTQAKDTQAAPDKPLCICGHSFEKHHLVDRDFPGVKACIGGPQWCECIRYQAAPQATDKETAAQFWAGVHGQDGMTAEQVKNELIDFHFMMEQVPKVYDHVTGGLLTKTNYFADTVIAAHDDHVTKLVDEAVEEAVEDAQATAKAEPLAWISADDMKLLHLHGCASVYELKQVFRLIQDHEQFPLYTAPLGPIAQPPAVPQSKVNWKQIAIDLYNAQNWNGNLERREAEDQFNAGMQIDITGESPAAPPGEPRT